MLEFAKKLAMEVGEKHEKAYQTSHVEVDYKSEFNPVTNRDTEAEEFSKKKILEKHPSHGILGEEGTSIGDSNEFVWVIDPLDGTINFIKGFPYFAVAISLFKNEKLLLGVVYHPITKELFYAEKGKGSFLNGKRIHLSKTLSLADSYLSTGFRYKRGEGFTTAIEKFKKVLEKAMVVRRTGSAALDLCNVAKGTFDGFFMYDLKKWDISAGLIIVEEAGGTFLTKEKNDHDVDIVIANPEITIQLKNLLEWS